MDLSPHFTLEEMTASQAAARLGISNNPPAAAVAALQQLCHHILEPVRAHFGRPVAISSGYRAPQVNKAIGGAAASQHCNGEAADFTVPGVPNIDVAQWIQKNLSYDQLILEFPPAGWVHCSWREDGRRQQDLTAKVIAGKTKYLPGIYGGAS